MAKNEIEGVNPAAEQTFETISEESLDATIKQAIHDLFVYVVAIPNASGDLAKLEIAEALRFLVSICPCVELEVDTNRNYHHEGGKILSKYFCKLRGSLVEVYVSTESSNSDIKVADKDRAIKVIRPALSDETKDALFQTAVHKFFNTPWTTEVGKLMVTGVLVTLSEREDLGRFEDAFKKHHALFSKLGRLYEKATVDALLVERSAASVWFAVDQAVLIIERDAVEIEKEQDTMMRMD